MFALLANLAMIQWLVVELKLLCVTLTADESSKPDVKVDVKVEKSADRPNATAHHHGTGSKQPPEKKLKLMR